MPQPALAGVWVMMSALWWLAAATLWVLALGLVVVAVSRLCELFLENRGRVFELELLKEKTPLRVEQEVDQPLPPVRLVWPCDAAGLRQRRQRLHEPIGEPEGLQNDL